MRVLNFLAIPALMVSSFACKRTYHELGQPAPPMEVVVSIKHQAPVSTSSTTAMILLRSLYPIPLDYSPTESETDTFYNTKEKQLAGALRDSLSAFVSVVPEGATAPPEALRLEVRVYDYYVLPRSRSRISAAHTLEGRALDSFGSPVDTYVNYLHLGNNALCYSGELLLYDPQKNKTVHLGSIPTLKIARTQKPIYDPERIDIEISRAFAETIAKQLQKKFRRE
ncbi:MAG: hypothetical protein LBC63_07430 [Holophagales bacterium]|jgi:hypothetical protein|nr:hypothetical protein [Holophagales bacterium]